MTQVLTPPAPALPGTSEPVAVRPLAPRPPWALTLVSAGVAAAFVLPLAYIVVRNADLGTDLFEVLGSSRVLTPARRSLLLATTVAATAAVVGTALAWLLVRTDMPGRRVLRLLAPLPLVYPTFVGAAAMRAAVAPGGLLEQVLGPLGLDRAPDIRGFAGAWLVLVLFTYPYVYLVVASRLASMPADLEESARLLGRGSVATFVEVVLPQAVSAVLAGTLLVFLYALSDFGAVAIMGYVTLSVGIFSNFESFNLAEGFSRSLVLGLLALAVVALERTVSRRRVAARGTPAGPALVYPLGRLRWPAFAAVVFLLANALFGPLSALGLWAWRGVFGTATVTFDTAEILEMAWRTGIIATVAAAVTVAAVLPVAYLTARFRSRLGGLANALVVSGFALPGVAIALSVVFFALRTPAVGFLYQTAPLLVLAYMVHFGAQTMRASQVAVGGVDSDVTDAARMLGAGRLRRFLRIELPLVTPGLAAGGGLVLLSVMKELPATLILAPTGFSTLATEIWSSYEAGFLAETGIASLVLVALSGILTWLLVIRRAERFD